MPSIIGTAGHIDHGKTSLVKALTGVDTDRLKEEKERGISIDLGFTHLELPDGARAGVVDVPGHERFIRNMLAGAHGIDLVLFVVAADDGVMPQTEEHLDILQLLGVRRAIFVITKVDLSSRARIAEVQQEIELLTSETPFERSPMIACSCTTGEGVEELRATIFHELEGWKETASPGYFRLPVDRAFVMQGHGQVVTGTALAGHVRVGDRVRCLPGGELFRVRSLQVHGRAQQLAVAGQRVALNLAGGEHGLERGQVICAEALTRVSTRVDATLQVRSTGGVEIKNHQRVRFHQGTAERIGKVVLLGREDKVTRAAPAYCQIVLREPVLTLRGDHFIIRDETAQRTLGGGVVIHPWASAHKRSDTMVPHNLQMLHRGGFADVVNVFLQWHEDFATPAEALNEFLNKGAVECEPLDAIIGIRAIKIEGHTSYTTRAKWDRLEQALAQVLREFHQAHALLPGMGMEELRQKLTGCWLDHRPAAAPPELSVRLFRAFLDEGERAGLVVREGNAVRLPEHTIELHEDDRNIVEKICSRLNQTPLAPPDCKQLANELAVGEAKLNEIIRVMERRRSIVKVAPDLYFLTETVTALRDTLCRRLSETGEITPAGFRDLFGTSRKYTIPLLEYFDRENVTLRVGDVRQLKKRWQHVRDVERSNLSG